MIRSLREFWRDHPEIREAYSETARERWRDPEYRERMSAALSEAARRWWDERNRTPSEFVREWFSIPEDGDIDDVLRANPFSRFHERLRLDEEERLDELVYREDHGGLDPDEVEVLEEWEANCR